ncbi:MAG: hypothetical protein R3C52_04960 [Hyphomonadaceae bacterium]
MKTGREVRGFRKDGFVDAKTYPADIVSGVEKAMSGSRVEARFVQACTRSVKDIYETTGSRLVGRTGLELAVRETASPSSLTPARNEPDMKLPWEPSSHTHMNLGFMADRDCVGALSGRTRAKEHRKT